MMLDKMRERFQGPFGWGILALIVVPLAITFGKMDWGTGSTNFAARVNGEEIPLNDFQRVYQNQLMAQQQAMRAQLPAELEDQLKRSVLDSLILNKVVTQFVRKQGYSAADSLLAEFIRTNPAFAVGGQFSKPAYEAALASQGLNPTVFEAQQRSALAIQQLQQGLRESAFATPEEFRRLIALDGERREVDYVMLDPRKLGAVIPVSDADVQSYYAANTDQFRTDESVTLDYVELSLADMARDYVPDEAALHQAYDADPTRFKTEEERRVRHILVAVNADRNEAAAKSLADDIARQLAAGGDFGALAKKYSSDPGSAANGGELGWAGRGVYVEPFEKAIFAMKPGETSAPVRTEFGFHIIQVEEVRPGAGRSFNEVHADLTEELKRQRGQDEFYALADRLDDLALENQNSLEPVAKQTGLELRHVRDFTRAGGGPFGKNPGLVAAVFGDAVLQGGENTPLIQLEEGRAIVARVAEHKLPAPRPLSDVHSEIVERLRNLRAANASKVAGEAILKSAEAGQDLAAAAVANGQALTIAGGMTRRSAGLPQELVAAVFRAPKPADGKPVIKGVPLDGGGYVVFRVTAVAPGQPDSIPRAERDKRKRLLSEQMAVAETEGLAAELREAANVVVSPTLLRKAEEQP